MLARGDVQMHQALMFQTPDVSQGVCHGFVTVTMFFSPRPLGRSKSSSIVVFCNVHHRSTRVQNWGFYLLDPSRCAGWGDDMSTFRVVAGNKMNQSSRTMSSKLSASTGHGFRDKDPCRTGRRRRAQNFGAFRVPMYWGPPATFSGISGGVPFKGSAQETALQVRS